MTNYVRYERIRKIVTPEELEKQLKEVIEKGTDIIYYDEIVLEKTEKIERIIMTMILGFPNKGKKIL